MKTNRRTLIGLSAAAAVAPCLPRVASACDDTWVQDIVWLRANDHQRHTVTFRHLPSDAARLKRPTFTMAFSTGRADDLQRDFFYGNSWTDHERFMGLASFYNTTDPNEAQNAVNVLDGGNRQLLNSSIYVVCWGEQRVYMVRADDGKVALVPHDWRYVVRVANVSPNEADVAYLTAKALLRLPTAVGATVYMNEDIARQFKQQADRLDQRWNFPIRVTDGIRNYEAVV